MNDLPFPPFHVRFQLTKSMVLYKMFFWYLRNGFALGLFVLLIVQSLLSTHSSSLLEKFVLAIGLPFFFVFVILPLMFIALGPSNPLVKRELSAPIEYHFSARYLGIRAPWVLLNVPWTDFKSIYQTQTYIFFRGKGVPQMIPKALIPEDQRTALLSYVHDVIHLKKPLPPPESRPMDMPADFQQHQTDTAPFPPFSVQMLMTKSMVITTLLHVYFRHPLVIVWIIGGCLIPLLTPMDPNQPLTPLGIVSLCVPLLIVMAAFPLIGIVLSLFQSSIKKQFTNPVEYRFSAAGLAIRAPWVSLVHRWDEFSRLYETSAYLILSCQSGVYTIPKALIPKCSLPLLLPYLRAALVSKAPAVFIKRS